MSSLRFIAAYSTGVAYAQTLTANVNTTATLTIQRQLNTTLSANVTASAVLRKQLAKTASAIVTEGAILHSLRTRTMTTVHETVSASLTRNIPGNLVAGSVTITSSLNYGKAYTHTLTASQSVTASVLHTPGKTFVASVVEAAISLSQIRFVALTADGVSIGASVSQLRQLVHTFPITISETPSLAQTKSVHTTLSVGVTSSARVTSSRARVFTATPVTVSASANRAMSKSLNASVQTTSSLVKQQSLNRIFLSGVTVASSLQGIKVKFSSFTTTISETVFSLRGIPTKHLTPAPIIIIAMLNKGGRYPQPPRVLQMYDLDDYYRLHALRGATVSYMHGIFEEGVAFDIYAAYVLAGNQSFYVCDNGVKQALDKNPALIRIQ